jgi:Exostosin family
LKIIPFHFITAPKNSGYRDCESLLRSHPDIEVVSNFDAADFVFYWSWGDDPKIMVDLQRDFFVTPMLADITGDHCWIPDHAEGLFFTTNPNPKSKCFEVPYSYRFLTQWTKTARLPQKYLASFQGSMQTNPKRRELFKFQSPDIFIKEQDGWVNDDETNKRIVTEHQMLMLQSKFTFCPVGIGSSSIRVIEAIFAGSIPILIDDYSHPFGDELLFAMRTNWNAIEHSFNHAFHMIDGEYQERLKLMNTFKEKFLLRDARKGIVNELGYLDWIYEKALAY